VTPLHRRLSAMLALLALVAFISGAGLDAPAVVPAALVLLVAVFFQPGDRLASLLEPVWRVAAVLLAGRAALYVLAGVGDPVLPMVDLLLLLLCAESLRFRDGSGDARHFALTFALLIASAAYRPGPAFALLFAAYVICATVLLVVGHGSREARARGGEAPLPSRAFLLRIAALSLVTLGVSGAVFVFFPRVSHGLASRNSPVNGPAVVGFSDRVSLGQHGSRIQANPQVVLRVEFPGGPPANARGLHLRGRSYNRFDGEAWSNSSYSAPRAPLAAAGQGWGGPVVEQVVYGATLPAARVLFGLHPVVEMSPISRIRPVRLFNGDFLYTGDADPAYRVRSRTGRPPAAELRQVQPDEGLEMQAHLQLPAVTPRLMQLADSLRVASPTMYDHVLSVERYLRTGFQYTLDLPATRREATLEHFLFVRRAGHCEYFSTAMAVLLRAGGVATRNVNGFLGGEWNEFGRYLAVTQNNAHSWVEVFFPGVGWVPFDPTPPGAGDMSAAGFPGLGRLRMLADGLNHRWGRWILDYDVRSQASLLGHLTRPVVRPAERRAGSSGAVLLVLLLAAAGGTTLFLVRRLRRARVGDGSAPARAYVTMRKAFHRAGFPPVQSQPPLAFAASLRGVPGEEDARRVVELYVAARFGGVVLSQADERQLRVSAGAAVRAARRIRRTPGA
jgi:protein-glutamine gamma-glutamyltransferase